MVGEKGETRGDEVPIQSARLARDGKTVFLGIDRLDYTKGIHARLRAFGELVSDGKLDAALTVPVRFGAASIAFEYSYANSSDTLRAESVRARLQTPF